MEINNKLESIDAINKLGLNKFPEGLFKRGDEEKIKEFVKLYPAKYYAIRDKSNAGGKFKLKIEKNDLIEETKQYDLFSINVSSANYADNQLMVGEIRISDNGEVYIIMTTDPNASLRDAYKKPEMNINTNIFDNKTINKIPQFNYLYNFIVSNNLLNVIVEFALYDIPVGIKQEKIVIYELRTNY